MSTRASFSNLFLYYSIVVVVVAIIKFAHDSVLLTHHYKTRNRVYYNVCGLPFFRFVMPRDVIVRKNDM